MQMSLTEKVTKAYPRNDLGFPFFSPLSNLGIYLLSNFRLNFTCITYQQTIYKSKRNNHKQHESHIYELQHMKGQKHINCHIFLILQL